MLTAHQAWHPQAALLSSFVTKVRSATSPRETYFRMHYCHERLKEKLPVGGSNQGPLDPWATTATHVGVNLKKLIISSNCLKMSIFYFTAIFLTPSEFLLKQQCRTNAADARITLLHRSVLKIVAYLKFVNIAFIWKRTRGSRVWFVIQILPNWI